MEMKFYVTLICAVLFLSFGCKQETCAEEAGLISMDQYLADNNIMPETLGDTGLRYIINAPGGAARPTIESVLTFAYEGRQTNDAVFDERPLSNPLEFRLNMLIQGWQLGIPLIGEGGNITLYIPSELAYGPRRTGDICPNSDLIFDLDLVSFIP